MKKLWLTVGLVAIALAVVLAAWPSDTDEPPLASDGRPAGASARDDAPVRAADRPQPFAAAAPAPEAAAAAAPTIAMVPPGEDAMLEGTVKRARSGEPVPGATVLVTAGRDGGELGRAATDDSGRFELTGLPPGELEVIARAPGLASLPGSRLQVSAGERQSIELVLALPASLAGSVREADGRAIAGAVVRAGSRATVRSDALGRFQLEGLPLGHITLEAAAGDRLARRSVGLGEGVNHEVELVLRPTGALAGRVVRADGRALEKPLRLFGYVGDGEVVTVTSDPEGHFEIPKLAAGRWRFTSYESGLWLTGAEVEVRAGEAAQAQLTAHEQSDEERIGRFAVERGTIGAAFEATVGGVAVSWAVSSGPAARSGLRVGDLLLSIDGVPVGNILDVYARAPGQPGSRVKLSVRREGLDHELEVIRAE